MMSAPGACCCPSSISIGATSHLRCRHPRSAPDPIRPRSRSTRSAGGSGGGDIGAAALPKDYFDLVAQVRRSLQSALSAGHDFVEIQFPVAGLTSVPGDADGNTEHNLCAKYLRQIVNGAFIGADISGVKVIFPDKTELKIALEGAEPDPNVGQWYIDPTFDDFRGSATYLEEPNMLQMSGLGKLLNIKQETVIDRVDSSDKIFVIAYPSVNLSEMIAVTELRAQVAKKDKKPIVVVNGELERIRSGYYPSFWARSELELLRDAVSDMETIYYIHNFKGSNPAVLFRQYPHPWQVYLFNSQLQVYTLVHEQPDKPSLQQVALEIIPSARSAL